MDLAGFCDKNIIVSDEALHCELVRGVKPLFLSVFPRCVVYDIVTYRR